MKAFVFRSYGSLEALDLIGIDKPVLGETKCWSG